MPPRKHVHEHRIKDFVERKYGEDPYMRMPYVVRSNGDIVYGGVDTHHKHILQEVPEADVTHMGFLVKSKGGDRLGRMDHTSHSLSYHRSRVPDEIMDEVEAEIKKHNSDAKFQRSHEE